MKAVRLQDGVRYMTEALVNLHHPGFNTEVCVQHLKDRSSQWLVSVTGHFMGVSVLTFFGET